MPITPRLRRASDSYVSAAIDGREGDESAERDSQNAHRAHAPYSYRSVATANTVSPKLPAAPTSPAAIAPPSYFAAEARRASFRPLASFMRQRDGISAADYRSASRRLPDAPGDYQHESQMLSCFAAFECTAPRRLDDASGALLMYLARLFELPCLLV